MVHPANRRAGRQRHEFLGQGHCSVDLRQLSVRQQRGKARHSSEVTTPEVCEERHGVPHDHAGGASGCSELLHQDPRIQTQARARSRASGTLPAIKGAAMNPEGNDRVRGQARRTAIRHQMNSGQPPMTNAAGISAGADGPARHGVDLTPENPESDSAYRLSRKGLLGSGISQVSPPSPTHVRTPARLGSL